MNHLFKQFIAHLVTFFRRVSNLTLFEADLSDRLLDSLIEASQLGI